MLSILIPVYNFDVVSFVDALVHQGRALDVPVEILAFDDGSDQGIRDINRIIIDYPEVNYVELPENLGRSKIRNELARQARFPYLLFLDGDGYPEHDDFLQQYIQHLTSNTVLQGGTSYTSHPPADHNYLLHWKVGRAREVAPAAQRGRQPYHSFTSNNFVVPAEVFRRFPFDEQIRQYGHEDTVFGLTLKANHIPIKHLDNPLRHIGLEPATVFLEKNKKAIENLITLANKYDWMDTTLLRTHRLLNNLQVMRLVTKVYGRLESRIEQALTGGSPRLWLFMWYKLVWLERLMKE